MIESLLAAAQPSPGSGGGTRLEELVGTPLLQRRREGVRLTTAAG